MQFSSKLAIATHILLVIAEFSEKEKVTSDVIAGSTNVNPVIIRNMLLKLQDAKIIQTKAGVGGSELTKPLNKITLKDIFYAVEEDKDLFKFHSNPNEDCPVGRNIHKLLDKRFDNAKEVMFDELSKITLDQLKIELDKLIKK